MTIDRPIPSGNAASLVDATLYSSEGVIYATLSSAWPIRLNNELVISTNLTLIGEGFDDPMKRLHVAHLEPPAEQRVIRVMPGEHQTCCRSVICHASN